jgi:hypothetical protein
MSLLGCLVITEGYSVAYLAPLNYRKKVTLSHREVGLNCEQIMALLDLNKEYHERQISIQLEFARVTEALEIKWGRIDELQIAKREVLLQRHAQLFAEHEALFFEMARRGHEYLTDEQLDRAESIYHAEKDAMLGTLESALNRAVGPHFQFAEARGVYGGVEAYSFLQSMEPSLIGSD